MPKLGNNPFLKKQNAGGKKKKFTVKRDKCVVCGKTVYPMEKVTADGNTYHQYCFKCHVCKSKLTVGTYAAMDNVVFCKPHFIEKFRREGKYNFAKKDKKEEKKPEPKEEKPKVEEKKEEEKKEEPKEEPVKKEEPKKEDAAVKGLFEKLLAVTARLEGYEPSAAGVSEGDKLVVSKSQFVSLLSQLETVTTALESGKLPAPTKSQEPSQPEPKKKTPVKTQQKTTGANLFSEINKGGNVTSGLNKVRKDQKTKYQKTQKPKVKFSSKAKKVKRITKPPVLELVRDQKWVVENYDGDKNVEVVIDEIKHTVYVYKCDNSNIVIKGKCNGITMDNCRKSNLIFETCVSSCELINCKSVKVQVLGTIPTISVDKTDGFNCFLNEKTLHTTIVTSKSSELNVSTPDDDNDYKESPLPEQYVSSFDTKTRKWTTTSSDHF